jgi:hypothetical protein
MRLHAPHAPACAFLRLHAAEQACMRLHAVLKK